MKHARAIALRSIDGLLERLRQLNGLIERKTGVFYRKSQAFIHFHEDAAGIFAHIKTHDGWRLLPIQNWKQIAAFLALATRELKQNFPAGR